jgi:hypothetical protein
MSGAVVKISYENFRTSSKSVGFSTKNAWARWARQRYPNNGVKGLMAEFGLTEGEAKGLIYAQASQPTIDKLLDHPRGGFGLGLEILAIRTGISLEQYIEDQARGAADERRRAEDRERYLESLEARWRARTAQQPGHPR